MRKQPKILHCAQKVGPKQFLVTEWVMGATYVVATHVDEEGNRIEHTARKVDRLGVFRTREDAEAFISARKLELANPPAQEMLRAA